MAEARVNTEEKKSFLRLGADTVLTHDTSEEFSLPDYVPEIRRLLCVKSDVLPESKYLGDNGEMTTLELGGTVTYTLIYTDDEGSLCSLPLTSSYEASTSLMSHPDTVFIDTVVDSATARVSAPRRLTLKARLKSRIWGWESVCEEEKIEGKSSGDELFIERKKESADIMSILPISMSDIRVSGKIDMVEDGEAVPLWCDAFVAVSEARCVNGSVSVRGEMCIKCVCKVGQQTVILSKTEPVAEEIEAQGVSPKDFASVQARCVSLSISNEERDGQGQLFFDLCWEMEGAAFRNTQGELTVDCYSTACESKEEYKEIELYSVQKAQNSSFTFNEGVAKKDNEIAEIIDVICDPVCEKVDFKGGKAVVGGKMNVTVIGTSEEKEGRGKEYVAQGYEVPFKYATDVREAGGEQAARCRISVGNVSARSEGDKLRVSAELYPAIDVFSKKRMRVLDSSRLMTDNTIKRQRGCVRVCFPREGETLWDIGKKYHTTVKEIREKNELDLQSSIEDIDNLII